MAVTKILERDEKGRILKKEECKDPVKQADRNRRMAATKKKQMAERRSREALLASMIDLITDTIDNCHDILNSNTKDFNKIKLAQIIVENIVPAVLAMQSEDKNKTTDALSSLVEVLSAPDSPAPLEIPKSE